ncbi:MAG TPA: PIN domain-containing protein [Rudaea sp.]
MMLDTHIVVQLYEGRTNGLSAYVKRELDRGAALISPTVVFELEMLHEIQRIRPNAADIVRAVGEDLGIRIAAEPFADIVDEALGFSFTRDPFDRLIVAHAALREAPLVTFDERIGAHYRRATS